MKACKGKPSLEVAVKVPHEMEGLVGQTLSSFVPSLSWRKERKGRDISLLKGAVVMDDQVDRIITEIEKTLREVEARYLLQEPLPVEVRVSEEDEPAGSPQKQLQPKTVSTHLAVSPPCQCVRAGQGRRVLVIDPQEAFGDGNHPSTRLALRLVDELLSGKYGSPGLEGWVLDAGCGSGVLALAAAALGGFRVLAVDLDPRAIDATRGNLRLNPGPGTRVFLALGELSCVRGPFYLVMANLVPMLHARAYKTLWGAVAPGGWLILSGFNQTHKDWILRPYFRHGATEEACAVDQTWVGTLLYKPGRGALQLR